MRRLIPILCLSLLPLVAQANPVEVEGQSLIAFGVVAFFAMVVESGIATLAVISSGALVVPLFAVLFLANLGVFVFAFWPLIGDVPLSVLEASVVLLDAVLIKLLTSAPFLAGSGVTWRRALIASVLGNAASYFVGVIASGRPWYVHM